MPSTNETWGYLVADVSRLLRRTFERKMLGIPLTFAEARALYYVSRHEGVRQIDLAELLEIQPIRLARLIDKLEALKLVTRKVADDDRRANHVFLQPAAQPILAQFAAVSTAIRVKATEGLTLAQIETLNATLAQIYANIQKI